MLGGIKFAIQGRLGQDRLGQGRLRPVYRRRRFDYGEGLLSGPAWTGLLAILAARRNALRAWLGEFGVRSVVVGALAAGLGVQASTTPSAAQGDAKSHTRPSHSSAARGGKGGGGLVAGIMKLSGSDGGHGPNAGRVLIATESAPPGVGGGQGCRLLISGRGAAQALGERIDWLGDIGLFDLFAAGGPNSGFRRLGNHGSGEHGSASDGSASEGSASEDSALVAFASGSSGAPSDDVLPGAGGVFGGQAGWPTADLAALAGSGSIGNAGGSGPDVASTSMRVLEDLHRRGRGGGVSEAFRVPGGASGGPESLGGVPEPAAWATMLLGFTLVGGSARQRRAQA